MRTLKFVYLLCFGILLATNSVNTRSPLTPDSEDNQRIYSCLNEKYKQLNTFSPIIGCEKNSRDHWLLSLDGGGARGLMHLLSLAKLESLTGKLVIDLFDGISGTSAGGIIACLLTLPDPNNPLRPKYSAQNLLDIIFPRRAEMFVKRWQSFGGLLGPRYETESIKKFLHNLIEENNYKNRLLPTVLVTQDLNSYGERLLATTDSLDFFTKDLAMATSAAPICFEPQLVTAIDSSVSYLLIDGGAVMDNPVLAGVALLQQSYGISAEKINVLSFGTGVGSEMHSKDSLRKGGVLSWGTEVINLCKTAQLSTTDNIAKFYLGNRYHRFQPNLGEGNVKLTNISDDYMNLLKAANTRMLAKNARELNKIILSLNAVAAAKKNEPSISRTIYKEPHSLRMSKFGLATTKELLSQKNLAWLRMLWRK